MVGFGHFGNFLPKSLEDRSAPGSGDHWCSVHEAVTVAVVTVWCTHLHAVCWECDLAGRPGVSGGCRAGGPLYVDSATPATHLLKMPHRRAACSYQRGDTHAAAGQHADTRRQELSTLEFN